MSVPVTTVFSSPDPGAAPTTLAQLVTILNALVSSVIPSTLTPYVVGSSTPLVEDQDKVWHRLDANGRPLGTYVYYNGFWVREPPSKGAQLGFFAGDPTVLFDADGLGLSGPGPVAYDYFGWQIANGNNGTANLSDQFIIGARMDNVDITGYDTGSGLWRTNVTGAPLNQGGVAEITLTADNTYRPAVPELVVGKFTADGNTRDDAGGLYGSAGDGTHPEATLIEADAGKPTPDSISTIPPFYALAYLEWVSYP